MAKYSLNDVAKRLGISKNAVKYRVKKLNQEYVINEDGKWFVTEEGFQEMQSIFGDGETGSTSETEPKKDAASFVEEYIETLKAEIVQKNKQIEDLQRLFDQEQKLHAQDLLLLQKPADEVPTGENTTEKKKNFWDRFRKN